ncbi:Fic/DOC family protein [Kribbella italica]|uniref:protein adenylyltransferase n=1 Tax=Kribbella italica TaxID=1540520 RepID=A0A7W9JCH5_9ACTN|nr:Fic family protein [Kribbella italica]MBB5839588.1 cell filamentation protein [Kribbella italica]
MTEPGPAAAKPGPEVLKPELAVSGVDPERIEAARRWNSLLWEEGGNVLRNKLGVKDRLTLRTVEYKLRAMRQGEIERGEVNLPRTFDAAHLQAIHQHLFQDVYEWSGQFRDVDIVKNGQAFVAHERTDDWMKRIGASVQATDWPNLSRDEFVRRIADVHTQLNCAHPFREGNGASTKLFLHQLTENTPYRLDFDQVEKAEWDWAAYESMTDPDRTGTLLPDKLEPVFDRIVVERDPQPAAATADPELAKAMQLQATAYPSVSTEQSGPSTEQSAVRAQPAGKTPEREV